MDKKNTQIESILNRDSDIIKFDADRIRAAIEKAYDAQKDIDKHEIPAILEQTIDCIKETQIENWPNKLVDIEQIQDCVEKSLLLAKKHKVARAYILYRDKQKAKRDKEHAMAIEKLYSDELLVIKNNWEKEPFDMSKIKLTFNIVAEWLQDVCTWTEFWSNFGKFIKNDLHTNDISKLMIKTAIDLITIENTKWEFVAGRLFSLWIYKQACRNRNIWVDDIYTAQAYKDLFDKYIELGHYYKDFYKHYSQEDILAAGEYLYKDQDFKYNHTTITAMNKRYLLNPNKVVMELPQEMFMSVALFLAIPEDKETRLQKAFKIYEYSAKQKISYPTPTLLNARTNFHQLSSCFKLNLDDDLRSIYHNVENMAQISKYGWWIGTYLWHIRSRGASIRGTKWASTWVLPWIKVINDTAIAVNQLWSRMWSISVTLDMWHRDIHDFLEMQTETGDIRWKSFDVFPAVSIPDLFMKRVENNQQWTLFDPHEIKSIYGKSLENFFWDEFEKFYEELENDDNITLKKQINAKDLFKVMLKSVVETGMPYAFFRDTVNRLNPNKHAGNVYSTQLCVEICQNTSESKFVEEVLEDGTVNIKYKPWDSVVCNLLSLNVAKIDFQNQKELEELTEMSARILDNVITMNYYPIVESEITAKKYRSVWLGFLWLAEYLATNHIAYDSKQAVETVDKMFEKMTLNFLRASNKLAKERWTYDLYEGSDYSKWLLFGRDKQWYKDNAQDPQSRENLIDDIHQDWVRFAYHFAPAPNTSSSFIVWTTAWLLPIYKKFFTETNIISTTVRVAPNLTKENFRYYKEYVNMNMNDVIDVISTVYKWIDQSISFERMINPQTTSPKDLYSYYFKSWKQWIKTIYYVRSMSMEVKECVSCSG